MIATNNFGIREMSVEREALVKTPKLFAIALATAVVGVADGALADQVKKLFFGVTSSGIRSRIKRDPFAF